MNKFFSTFLFLFCFISFSQGVFAGGVEWQTDYQEAVAQAEKQSKSVVLFFTGSDWCVWCKKLEKESLATSNFSDATIDKFVFLMVDFPRKKKISTKLSQQNENLKKYYNVTAFPTVVIINPSGEKIGTTGYQKGGGEQYAEHLIAMVDGKMKGNQSEKAVSGVDGLFEKNKRWAEDQKKNNPQIFKHLSESQTPKYLWIGCSDSRVPAEEILGLNPGELFVHRNVANVVPHTDFNCLSVLEYAVNHLNVEHVFVCGHYECGGVSASMENAQFGLVDNWLRNIRDVYSREKEELDKITDKNLKFQRLVELNVLHQVMNVCHTTIVQNAWAEGKKLTVHGWVFDISTGLIKDLHSDISSLDEIHKTYRTLKLH